MWPVWHKKENCCGRRRENVKEVQYNLHLSKAESFFKELKVGSEMARNNPVEPLCFGYQQNAPLLWIYNFCVILRKLKSLIFYVWWNNRSEDEIWNNKFSTLPPRKWKLYIYSRITENHITMLYLFTPVKIRRFERNYLQISSDRPLMFTARSINWCSGKASEESGTSIYPVRAHSAIWKKAKAEVSDW